MCLISSNSCSGCMGENSKFGFPACFTANTWLCYSLTCIPSSWGCCWKQCLTVWENKLCDRIWFYELCFRARWLLCCVRSKQNYIWKKRKCHHATLVLNMDINRTTKVNRELATCHKVGVSAYPSGGGSNMEVRRREPQIFQNTDVIEERSEGCIFSQGRVVNGLCRHWKHSWAGSHSLCSMSVCSATPNILASSKWTQCMNSWDAWQEWQRAPRYSPHTFCLPVHSLFG